MRKTIILLVVAAALPWAASKARAQEPAVPAREASTMGYVSLPQLCDTEYGDPYPPCIFDEGSRGWLHRFFDAEWYFSWGASREWWANTNIHVSQPGLGSNFTAYGVRATDDPSWGSSFSGQYNIRLGRFIDEDRTWAVELNFDHTKYTSVVGQTAHIAGTVNGKPVDGTFLLDNKTFSYDLHNGANHLMVNLVKRYPLIGATNETFSLAAIGKFGVGAVLPHAENTIFGNTVNVGPKNLPNGFGVNSGWWQLNGFTTGVEGGFRFVFCKPFYLELTDKVAFAQLYNVPVAGGTARHSLWMNEVILSVGVTLGARGVR